MRLCNFVQIFKLRGEDDPRVKSWMDKKTDKYTSPSIQNEMLQITFSHGFEKDSIMYSRFSVLLHHVDECVDASNREQLVLCFWWVDKSLDVHEDFFGLYQALNITSDALQAVIKDTLLRMNLSLARCRGQCYDGDSNMAGAKRGVAKATQGEENRAIFSRCCGHSLNLAASNAIKGCKVMSDTLDTTYEICKLIKFSPK